jgi:hypothetical protein
MGEGLRGIAGHTTRLWNQRLERSPVPAVAMMAAAPWRAPVVRYFCGGAALQNSRWGRHASKDANLYTGTQRTLCS